MVNTKRLEAMEKRIKTIIGMLNMGVITEAQAIVSCCDCKKELEDAKEAIKDMQDELNYKSSCNGILYTDVVRHEQCSYTACCL